MNVVSAISKGKTACLAKKERAEGPSTHCCTETKMKLGDMSTDHPSRRGVCWGRLQTITESLILLAFYFWSEFEL